MDYGHTVGNSGILQDNPADNLNAENWNSVANSGVTGDANENGFDRSNIGAELRGDSGVERAWGNNSLGKAALSHKGENVPKGEVDNSGLGEVTVMNPAPASQLGEATTFNQANIRTTGDALEKSSILEVDNAISKLSRTGDLSNFYDEIRDMTEVNLQNSFNRKLGV